MNLDYPNSKLEEMIHSQAFQKHFQYTYQVIATLQKIPALSNPKDYEKILERKKAELENPILPNFGRKHLFLDLD